MFTKCYIVNYKFVFENLLQNSLFSLLGSLNFAHFRGHPVSSLEMPNQEFVLGKNLPLHNKKKRGCVTKDSFGNDYPKSLCFQNKN
jgi:hypothetical protein